MIEQLPFDFDVGSGQLGFSALRNFLPAIFNQPFEGCFSRVMHDGYNIIAMNSWDFRVNKKIISPGRYSLIIESPMTRNM